MRKRAAGLGLALAGVWLTAGLMGFSREMGHWLAWAAAFALLGWLNIRFFSLPDRRARRVFGGLGFLFVCAQAAGLRLDAAGETGAAGLAMCLGAGACLAPTAGYAFWLGQKALCGLSQSPEGRMSARRVYGLCLACLLLCWLPVYLAYWPGVSSYDIYTQMDEILSGQLTNRNPLLHTLVMGGLYLLGQRFGRPDVGYTLFVLLQMAVMAACYAAVMRYLWQKRAPRALFWTALALFAVFPVHSVLAVSDTKDALFTALLCLLVIRLHRVYEQRELLRSGRFWAGFLTLTTLMCLMRNNAFTGLILLLPVGLWALGRDNRRRVAALALSALALYAGAGNGLKALFGASGGLVTEWVSVQSQQMGRVYALYSEQDPDNAYEIAYYLPTVENYTSYTADPLKTFANVRQPDRLWGFIKLWGRIGLSYPLTYLDAWLLNTKGYWQLSDVSHAHIYSQGVEDRRGYLLLQSADGLGLSLNSRLESLEKLYTALLAGNEYQRFPVLSLLFAPATWLWLCAGTLATALWRRDRRTCLMIALVAGSFLPLLFGACVLIRYAYPFVSCMPLFALSVWQAGAKPPVTAQSEAGE